MSDQIWYYSTNRLLEHGFPDKVSFAEALIRGQAPDKGLFMPDRIPVLDYGDIFGLKGKSYIEAAVLVMSAFLKHEMPAEVLRKIVEDSYPFEVPLESVYGTRKYVMRLDQGPTASFKDFAARLMARLMSCLRYPGKHLNILVATSGDTGSAVGEAFKGVEGIDVYIFYPRDEVSGRQKKQLDTIGDNVMAISVDGKFDDCQSMAKKAFTDPDFDQYNLTSANSINIGRILPQIVYYVYAYARLCEENEEVIFSVPSGNFGDALGCEYARRMGLPVKKIIVATNKNDEFLCFMESGEYKKVFPSRNCISNAMNVGHPSNLARFFDLYGGIMDHDGKVFLEPDIEEMKRWIYPVSITDGVTRACIKEAWSKQGILLEPHGAVGWQGLMEYLGEMGEFPLCISVETAHPAKFPEEIKKILGIEPELPESMKGIDKRKGESAELSGGYGAFKEYLLSVFNKTA